ncbi:MAG TPA: alanyl-tRNA editing protein [Thermoflexia bacterium]|nr:alanyl-tRNA editing protein [Thermoflexia bacterium]
MTRKLYYESSKTRTFTAQLVARQQIARGPAVQLDQTAFYPTGGGQAHDTGTLNGIPVLDVWSDAEGAVWHLLAQPLAADHVTGELNWERRFDHIQQHTGQHLLSAALLHCLGAITRSVHFGNEGNTLDTDYAGLSWEQAYTVANEVNRIIWENRAVSTQFVTSAELSEFNLRRQPQVTGNIRLVIIADCDITPCGGTHAEHTGEIGLLKITGLTSYKGGTRISFLCGERALRDYRRALRLLRQVSLELTTAQNELPAAIERLHAEAQENQRALVAAQKQLNRIQGEQLWAAAPVVNGVRELLAHWPERPHSEALALAKQLRERPQTLLLLATGDGRSSTRLICARSDDLDLDANAILHTALKQLGGGGGGGSPTFAQGGGPPAPPETIRAALQTTLKNK